MSNNDEEIEKQLEDITLTEDVESLPPTASSNKSSDDDGGVFKTKQQGGRSKRLIFIVMLAGLVVMAIVLSTVTAVVVRRDKKKDSSSSATLGSTGGETEPATEQQDGSVDEAAADDPEPQDNTEEDAVDDNAADLAEKLEEPDTAQEEQEPPVEQPVNPCQEQEDEYESCLDTLGEEQETLCMRCMSAARFHGKKDDHLSYCRLSERLNMNGKSCRGSCGDCQDKMDAFVQCADYSFVRDFDCCRSQRDAQMTCMTDQLPTNTERKECSLCAGRVINNSSTAVEYCANMAANCEGTCGPCLGDMETLHACESDPVGTWTCDGMTTPDTCDNIESSYNACLDELDEDADEVTDALVCRLCFEHTLRLDFGTPKDFCLALHHCEAACGTTCATQLEEWVDCAHLVGSEFSCSQEVSEADVMAAQDISCPLQTAQFSACFQTEFNNVTQANACFACTVDTVRNTTSKDEFCGAFRSTCTETCTVCSQAMEDFIDCQVQPDQALVCP